MPPTEWFYTRGSKRFGPVSAMELKQLADHGELAAEELVWREGMEQWVPARRVKGLFDHDVPSTKEDVSGSAPSLKNDAVSARADTVKIAEPPTPAAPPASDLAQPRPARPTFESSPSAFERAREGSSQHLFDALLETARNVFDAEFVRATAALFAAVGHYALYAAMLLLVGIQVALGVMNRSLWAILFGLGAAAVLAVLQYAARRIAGVLDRLDGATVSRMPSPVFLDCCALLSFVASLLALVGWTVFAVATQDFGWIFWAVIAFILLEYTAVVALNPESLRLTLTAEATAGEEAIGILSFLVKLGVRSVPVVFGVGVVWGGCLLLYAVMLLAMPSIGEGAKLNIGSGWLGQEVLKELALSPAQLAAANAAVLLLLAAACPVLAYLGFLACHMGIELLRALLAIPEKLDLVAEGKKPEDLMP
jgi:hypothetical protein